jgi:hypothetical protein
MTEKPVFKNCQQCRVYPAAYKAPTAKGKGFRWKCESCFHRTAKSGFKDKLA